MDSVALDRAGMRQLLALKTKLGSNIRHFVLSEDVIEKSGKAYIYTPHDIRLLRFASGAMGSNSDCFILYAVAKLGICDMESIRLFLKSIKKILCVRC